MATHSFIYDANNNVNTAFTSTRAILQAYIVECANTGDGPPNPGCYPENFMLWKFLFDDATRLRNELNRLLSVMGEDVRFRSV
jgi:hypothetical protein